MSWYSFLYSGNTSSFTSSHHPLFTANCWLRGPTASHLALNADHAPACASAGFIWNWSAVSLIISSRYSYCRLDKLSLWKPPSLPMYLSFVTELKSPKLFLKKFLHLFAVPRMPSTAFSPTSIGTFWNRPAVWLGHRPTCTGLPNSFCASAVSV